MGFLGQILTNEREIDSNVESYLLNNTKECPYCGHWFSDEDRSSLNMTGLCPDCGNHITSNNALSLVQEFNVHERTEWS